MKIALVVIDLQNGVCEDPTFYDRVGLVERVNHRIDHYRKHLAPIIFVQHEDFDLKRGSISWQLLDDLHSTSNDFYVYKGHANSFFKTNLQTILQENDIDSLEIWGAQTEYCVDATIKFAHGLGYQLFTTPFASSTINNATMTAKETIRFYERIWNKRFVSFNNPDFLEM